MIYREDKIAYSLYVTIFILLALIAMSGCKTMTTRVVRLASELDASGAPTTEQYQIPVEQNKIIEPAGWENDKVLEIIVPPSDKPTVLHVKKKKSSLRQALLPMKKETSFDMASDNPKTTAKEEAKTPWWYWLIGVIASLGVGWFIISKYLDAIKSFFGGAWSLISKVWGK